MTKRWAVAAGSGQAAYSEEAQAGVQAGQEYRHMGRSIGRRVRRSVGSRSRLYSSCSRALRALCSTEMMRPTAAQRRSNCAAVSAPCGVPSSNDSASSCQSRLRLGRSAGRKLGCHRRSRLSSCDPALRKPRQCWCWCWEARRAAGRSSSPRLLCAPQRSSMSSQAGWKAVCEKGAVLAAFAAPYECVY